MNICSISAQRSLGAMGYNVLKRWAIVALVLCTLGLITCETTQSVGVAPPVSDGTLQVGQILGTIYFSAESSVLSEQSLRNIQKIATTVLAATTEEAQVVLIVHGHTALAGTPEGRARLSRQRAEVVAQQLRAGGIAAGAIQIDSFGAEQPAANNSTAEGRELNRRTLVSVRSIQ